MKVVRSESKRVLLNRTTMDFFGRLGSLLSETLESGDFLRADSENREAADSGESDDTIEDLPPPPEESPSEPKRHTKSARSGGNPQTKSAGKTSANPGGQRVRFVNAQFFKNLYESKSEESPRVQVYKFARLLVPESVKAAFRTLGIPENSDLETAKKIYREKLMYYHPDKWIGTPYLETAQKNTQALTISWEVVREWLER